MIDKKLWKRVREMLRLIDKLPGECPFRIEYQAFMMLSDRAKMEENIETN